MNSFRLHANMVTMRNELETLYADSLFVSLFPKVGQPAESPGCLAVVSILQFAREYAFAFFCRSKSSCALSVRRIIFDYRTFSASVELSPISAELFATAGQRQLQSGYKSHR